jgi:tetratricopeptide (TPR) repeat protein
MYETQTQLADAYLAAGKGAEARVIAEDLVAREPWEGAHIERFRRALIMLRIPEPDTVIAERLSGQSPFVATDHFADPEDVAAARASEPLPPQPDVTPVPVTQTTETLDDVFTEMRDGAAREQGDDEAAQYIQLAETYLEMGMTDEAIGSFETAAESPRHRFEAASRLARLHRKQGNLRHALDWFQRAAEAPPTTPEDGHALRYDLGVTLEESGEKARALATFLELAGDTGGYRDAADRAERLAKVQAGG